MAMYENLGYCPSNAFVRFVIEESASVGKNWNKARTLLGDRIGYMVYTYAGCNYYGYCYAVEALVAAKSNLALEVADKLQDIIPECVYGVKGKMIQITDVLNPFVIPGVNQIQNSIGQTFVSTNRNTILCQDERFLIGITDEGDHLHMYFFKKHLKK